MHCYLPGMRWTYWYLYSIFSLAYYTNNDMDHNPLRVIQPPCWDCLAVYFLCSPAGIYQGESMWNLPGKWGLLHQDLLCKIKNENVHINFYVITTKFLHMNQQHSCWCMCKILWWYDIYIWIYTKYIYTNIGLGKTVPPDCEIYRNL